MMKYLAWFAALAALMFAIPAHAETRTPYQEYAFAQNSTCSGNPVCRLNFPRVPAGARLELSNASCYVKLKGANGDSAFVKVIQLLVLKADNTLVTASNMAPYLTGRGVEGGSVWRTFSFNHPIRAFAPAGRHFQAYVEQNEVASFDFVACHISGDMVTP
jgi:hypothetical protein